jgi:hypothetical protein
MFISEQELLGGEPQKKHDPNSDQLDAFTQTIAQGANIWFNSMTTEDGGLLVTI